jgi:hypothetical protein
MITSADVFDLRDIRVVDKSEAEVKAHDSAAVEGMVADYRRHGLPPGRPIGAALYNWPAISREDPRLSRQVGKLADELIAAYGPSIVLLDLDMADFVGRAWAEMLELARGTPPELFGSLLDGRPWYVGVAHRHFVEALVGIVSGPDGVKEFRQGPQDKPICFALRDGQFKGHAIELPS